MINISCDIKVSGVALSKWVIKNIDTTAENFKNYLIKDCKLSSKEQFETFYETFIATAKEQSLIWTFMQSKIYRNADGKLINLGSSKKAFIDFMTSETSGGQTNPSEDPLFKIEGMWQAYNKNKDMDTEVLSIYGIATQIDGLRRKQFKQDVINRIILRKDLSGHINVVTDIYSLQRSILDYKQSLFKLLVNYINEYNGSSLSSILYKTSVKIINDDAFIEAMNEAKKLFKNVDVNKAYSEQDNKVINAVSAYLNLKYFDEMLEEEVDMLAAAPELKGKEIGYTFQGSKPIIKYRIQSDSKGKVVGWNTSEYRDGLKESSPLVKTLLEAVEIVDENGLPLGSNLDAAKVISAWTSLLYQLKKVSETNEDLGGLINQLDNINDNPTQTILNLFDGIFRSKRGLESTKAAIQDIINKSSINKNIERNFQFTIYDLNVLRTFYNTFIDPRQLNIQFAETRQIRNGEIPLSSLLISELMPSLLIRVNTINYWETIYNDDKYVSRVHPRWESTRDSKTYKDLQNSNFALQSPMIIENLIKTYNIERKNVKSVNIKIGGVNYTLSQDTPLHTNRLTGYDKSITMSDGYGKDLIKSACSQLFDGNKFTSGKIFDLLQYFDGKSDTMKDAGDLLKFIDDMLNLGLTTERGLNILETWITLNRNRDNKNGDNPAITIIKQLVSSAAKVAQLQAIRQEYNNYLQQAKTNDKEPKTLLNFIQDGFGFNNVSESELKKAIIYSFNGFEGFKVIGDRTWIDEWWNATAQMMGTNVKSTTKNQQGNNVANTRPSSLNGQFREKLRNFNENGGAKMLFTKDSSAVIGLTPASDLQSKYGIKKEVKSANVKELMYDSFVNNFLNNIMLNNVIAIQPTVYSDKTTIALALIDLTKQIQYGKQQKLIGDISDSEIQDLWFSSVGNFFKQQHDKVMSDLRKILGLEENTTIYDINDILKTKTYEELNQLRKNYNIIHPDDKINIVEDLHYRRVNGKLALNELVVYYNELYSNRKDFNARVKKEQIKFAQDFLDYGVKIYYDGILSSFIGSNHGKKIIESIMNTDDVSEFKQQWFQNNKLIIAKTKDGKIIQSGEIVTDDAIINPLLLRYFNLDNLVSANIKYPLLGAETSHPNKASVNLKNIASQFTPGIFTSSEINKYSTDLVSLKKGISKTKGNKQKELKRIWNKLVYETISAAEGTQYKRNVIMPATFQTRLTNSLRGNSKMVKVATIRDTHGTMFTINGNQKTDQEVNDGAARVTPEEVILMNGALGDQAVSYDIVKSIGYNYDPRTGTMSELKFAAHTLSNAMMHISNGSEYQLFNLYKQNTNMKWDQSIQDSDITNNKQNCVNTKINFNIDITTGKAFKDGKLMYEDSNGKFEIVDMIKNGNIYYTIEQDSNYQQLLVAQLFINDVPMKIRQRPEQQDEEFITQVEAMYNSDENITTIDSTYKLWEAMGGMYSGHYNDNAKFVFDESSHYAVANYMNNYNIAIKENPFNIQTQEYYSQPLKDTFISYNVNTSAMKCGQTNVNDEECWKGMKEMDWMEFDSTVFGPQMDSDHVADEAEMSEFTQVMSSVDAGGKMHWLAKSIFQDLGNIANTIMAEDVQALQEYIEANIGENVSEERKRIIKSKLYHIIGSEFIKNGSIRDDGLGRAIIEKVNTEFRIRNNNHFNDAHKIPFSDPNIYSQVISSYVTRVNKAVKRKYSGIGDVITPGYNVAQIYEINGIPYLFSDLYREAISKGYVADDTAISYRQKQQNIVNQYLDALQKEQPIYTTRDWVEPTQIVDVLDSEGNWIATYDLDNVNDYYEFYTGKKPELQQEGLQYRVNVRRPKNLRPQRVAFKYRYNGQEYYGNLFQLKEVYEAFTTGTKTKNIDKVLYRLTHEYKTNIYDQNGVLLNNVEIIPESIINEAAELLASNTYKTKMGQGDRSLNDILVNGLNTPEVKPININDSQIVMIDNKGNHTLITFNQPIESNYIKEKGFDDIKVEYDEYGNLSKHANINGFFMEIGRGVLQKNMHIDKNRRIIYKGKIIDSDEYFVFDDKVFKSVDFIKRYSKSQYSDGKVNKYNLYYLDEAALRELFGDKFKEDDVYIKLSNIIGRIFSGGHYSHIQLNTNITETKNIKKIFDKLRNSYTINKVQRHIINETFNFLNNPKYDSKKNVWNNGYQIMLKKCLEDIKKIREVQFEASRYYTVARIPAQSLQSYMQMKLMGYINTESNVAIVSHWQTELQGSDY